MVRVSWLTPYLYIWYVYHGLPPISTYRIMAYPLSLHMVRVSWLTPYLYIWYMYHNLPPISTYGTCIMTYSLSLNRVVNHDLPPISTYGMCIVLLTSLWLELYRWRSPSSFPGLWWMFQMLIQLSFLYFSKPSANCKQLMEQLLHILIRLHISYDLYMFMMSLSYDSILLRHVSCDLYNHVYDVTFIWFDFVNSTCTHDFHMHNLWSYMKPIIWSNNIFMCGALVAKLPVFLFYLYMYM